ncbi:MBL fold metallo-hydrolase [Pontibacter rugosus]
MFFIVFFEGGSTCHVLIDCGVFVGTPGAKDRMQKIALDIKETCKGVLDVVVATHEHWDHLSGFSFAEHIFEQIDIHEVWVAWTEDMQHPLAQALREERHQTLKALHGAVNRLKVADPERASEIEDVLSFHGPLMATGKVGTAEQIALVQKWGKVKYLRPGEQTITLPNLPDLKIYVLGPPEDAVLVRRSNPKKGQVYEKEMMAECFLSESEYNSFYAAAISDTEVAQAPFHQRFVIPLSETHTNSLYGSFFEQRYGFGAEQGQGPAWRRIDIDWLGVSDQLALALDSNTNNTSLVLAFEIAKEKVLLFPGDAQVGNWLSWDKYSWEEEGREITGADLVKRTILYKVGHHGSHNATLAAKGLELMESDDLMALLPVDEEQAARKRWLMPFAPLYKRLIEKTHGRILRADSGIPEQPESTPSKVWHAFLNRIRKDTSEDNLWVEVTI